jgi:hypothetical protein
MIADYNLVAVTRTKANHAPVNYGDRRVDRDVRGNAGARVMIAWNSCSMTS